MKCSYSKIIFIFAISLLVTSCSAIPAKPDREQQEIAIYSLLLDENPQDYIIGTPIVVLEQTYYYESQYIPIDLDRAFPSMEAETFEDYQRVNQGTQTIDLILMPNKPYVLISDSELENLIDKYDNWEKFSQEYPETHVYTYFSKIGFNNEGNQAFVYMAHYCGAECGVGYFYLLRFDGKNWKIEDSNSLWNA